MKNSDYNETRLRLVSAKAAELNASDYLNNVTENNPSKDLPYHNNQHAYAVALNAAEGAVQQSLPTEMVRTLFIAGLYHDWDHTGTKDEKENIRRAANGALEAIRLYEGEEALAWEVMFLIYATSGTFAPANLPVRKAIIRDADKLQNLEPDYEAAFRGLSKEFGIKVDIETTVEYLAAHPFKTEWAKQRLAKATHL